MRVPWSVRAAAAVGFSLGCAVSPPPGTGGTGGAGGAGTTPVPGTISLSGAAPTPVSATIGLNYWLWPATWGNTIAGTDAAVAALSPRYLRIGGHNNDNNMPDRLDGPALAAAVAYAKAVGAEPILQVPLLADTAGAVPGAADAAALVTLANVTGGHGIRYFSIGNEPDLYPDQEATLKSYTPADYCAQVMSFVPAMKAVDPTIQIIGPELSWKYLPGNDWLTPILKGCGSAFDVIAVHRYPFAPEATTVANAQQDAAQFKATIDRLRALMTAAGVGGKPLAITETNITYDGMPGKDTLEASPGTLAAGLWTADLVGTARAAGLWTTLYWSVSEDWTLGLITRGTREQRPAYHALRLWAEHAPATALVVSATPSGVHAYAGRAAEREETVVMIVNWNRAPQALTITQTTVGGGAAPPAVTITVPPLSMTAVEIADSGGAAAARAWTYGPDQSAAKQPPAALTLSSPP